MHRGLPAKIAIQRWTAHLAYLVEQNRQPRFYGAGENHH
jgi:hypothetical protein